jgi:DNA mismatch repair protein MutL
MRVKELDPHLVNKIAAGEVIERPASVVKELVENSLDAGSTHLEIVIEGGGIQQISVADDGSGMSREDLLLSIRRHTTSKISSEADLQAIRTLGFRGEALASLVEVSRTTLTSKDDESPEATELQLEGGTVKAVHAAGRGRGTTVRVQDLFFNTPARRKFLKSEKTEYYHILRMVKRYVLSYPQIGFRLIHDGRAVLESPQSRELRQAVAHLYDADFAQALLDGKDGSQGLRVWGLVGPPERASANRNDQYLFVNGRYVRDSAVQYAIARAYEGSLERERHPAFFLFVEIDPQLVDVNVHPQKEEVRFSNARLVQAGVKRAVEAALVSSGRVTQLRPPRAQPASAQSTSPVPFTRSPAGRPPAGQDHPQLDLKRELLEVQRTEPTSPLPQEMESFRVIGQLHGTYILIQTNAGLELIDQHVAHERVLYERYYAQIKAGQVRKQRLLIPLTIELPPDQAEFLDKHLELLEQKLGIGLERFGGGTFILRDWPESLADALTKDECRRAIERVLDVLEHEDEPGLEELAARVAADQACEAAVVKNTPLNPEAAATLVAQLKRCQNPYRCPHGRPIIISYSLRDLERAFGRR